MIREILQVPDERLRTLALPLPSPKVDDRRKEVAQDLRDTFAATEHCIGLAATQLGHRWQGIIVDVTPRRTETYVMLNPRIVKISNDLQMIYDGCMSIRHGQKHAYTRRPKRLTIEWEDEAGDLHRQKFTGLLAACIHHELDHLYGILFTDRIVAAMSAGH